LPKLRVGWTIKPSNLGDFLLDPKKLITTAAGRAIDTYLKLAWNGSIFSYAFDGVVGSIDPRPNFRIVEPPSSYLSGLQVFKSIVISGSRSPQGEGSVAATFDNVRVNGATYDTFSASAIDSSKWGALEFVREVQTGKLAARVAASAGTLSNGLSFQGPEFIQGIQANVAVSQLSTPNRFTRTRLLGSFYRDGRTGRDVIGELALGADAVTGLHVHYYIWRCSDSNCTAFDRIFDGTLQSASLGSIYTLNMSWDGDHFTFKSNNTVKYVDPRDLAPDGGDPSMKFKSIETRIGGGSGQANITATFDNIYINLQP
jgi:hypothetical protein